MECILTEASWSEMRMNDGVGIDIHHLNDSGQAGEKMSRLSGKATESAPALLCLFLAIS